jgi:hypothetical protein
MTLQVSSFVAGSKFYNANKKLQHKLDNFRKDKPERRLFKKEEKNLDKAGEEEKGSGKAGDAKAAISWLMFFTAPVMRELEKDRGQKIEDMDFRETEPFRFRVYQKEHYRSLNDLARLILKNQIKYLEIEDLIDNESLKHMLCLIRDSTGRLDAAKQVMAEKQA